MQDGDGSRKSARTIDNASAGPHTYTMTLNTVDMLSNINTATKYPSIYTYHSLGDRGILDEGSPTIFPAGQVVIGTEKVDGTNVRIVFTPDGNYLLGSREELLYAGGDIIHNPAQGIVAALRDKIDWYVNEWPPLVTGKDTIVTVYGELYGGKIGKAAKNYSSDGSTGFRIFDIALIDNAEAALDTEPAQLSVLRESSILQRWYTEDQIAGVGQMMRIPITPRLFTIPSENLPITLLGMQEFMRTMTPNTLVGIDTYGPSEGIVLRTFDRSKIAKARFEDYARTLKKVAAR